MGIPRKNADEKPFLAGLYSFVQRAAAAVVALTALSPSAFALSDRVQVVFPSTSETRVEIRGVIEPQCDFSWKNSGDVDLGDLTDHTGRLHGRSVAIPFALNCNSAFRYTVSADRGALEHVGSGEMASPGFLRRVLYDVNVEDPRIRPREPCASDEMSSGRDCVFTGSSSSGPAEGALTVTWEDASSPLLAGRYRDRLRITVVPRISGD